MSGEQLVFGPDGNFPRWQHGKPPKSGHYLITAEELNERFTWVGWWSGWVWVIGGKVQRSVVLAWAELPKPCPAPTG